MNPAVTRHRYCETCGICVECDGEDDCYDRSTEAWLPSSAHYAPLFEDDVPPLKDEPPQQ